MKNKGYILFFLVTLWICLVAVVLVSPNIPYDIEHNVAYSDTSKYYVENSVNDTGALNVVSGIITDYRAFDTLGEVTVLFTGVVAALVTLKKNEDGKEHRGARRMK